MYLPQFWRSRLFSPRRPFLIRQNHSPVNVDDDRPRRGKVAFAASVVSKDPIIGGGIFRRRSLSDEAESVPGSSGVALRSPFSPLIGRRRDGRGRVNEV